MRTQHLWAWEGAGACGNSEQNSTRPGLCVMVLNHRPRPTPARQSIMNTWTRRASAEESKTHNGEPVTFNLSQQRVPTRTETEQAKDPKNKVR